MNSVQNSKFRMYHSVNNHLLANKATWANSIGFSAVVNRFKALFDNIGQLVGEKARIVAGVTLSKQLQKISLVELTLMISGTLVAIASEAKNVTMVKKFGFSRSQLEDMGSEKLCPVCRQILGEALVHKEKMALFNITDISLQTFENLIAEFELTVTAPRNAIAARKSIGEKLKVLFREADEVLENQLDKTVSIFKSNDTLFVNDYHNNRVIIDKGTRSTRISGKVTDSITLLPLKNVLVSIDGTHFLTNTKADGSFSLKVPLTGSIKVVFELGGFDAMTKEDVELKLGKTTQLEATLVRNA